jgi:hypothetical protein
MKASTPRCVTGDRIVLIKLTCVPQKRGNVGETRPSNGPNLSERIGLRVDKWVSLSGIAGDIADGFSVSLSELSIFGCMFLSRPGRVFCILPFQKGNFILTALNDPRPRRIFGKPLEDIHNNDFL